MKTKVNWKILWYNYTHFATINREDDNSRICAIECNDAKELDEKTANAYLIAAAPDMIEALQSVNNYFIDLQNKCALTNPDERAWKLVSKALNKALNK